MAVATSIGKKPYVVIREEDNKQYRLFAKYDSAELFWHRDHEDREVKCVMGQCEFQRENGIPVKLEAGDTVCIAKEEYHRIINREETPFLLEVKFLSK